MISDHRFIETGEDPAEDFEEKLTNWRKISTGNVPAKISYHVQINRSGWILRELKSFLNENGDLVTSVVVAIIPAIE